MRKFAVAFTYENRRFSRVEVTRSAVVVTSSGESILVEINDISMCGLLFTASTHIPVGSVCTIRFSLDDELIDLKVVVLRTENSSISAEITGIKEGSYGNLRKLLVENTDAPGNIDTELIARDDLVPPSY